MDSTWSAGTLKESLSVTIRIVFLVLSTITWQVLHSCRCSSRRARSSELFGVVRPALNLPRTKPFLLVGNLPQRLRGLALPEKVGSGVDSDADEPSRKLGSSLKAADMLERP